VTRLCREQCYKADVYMFAGKPTIGLNVLRTLSLSLLSRWVDAANLEELSFISSYGYVLGSTLHTVQGDIVA
jgi:hypothetical protein